MNNKNFDFYIFDMSVGNRGRYNEVYLIIE